MSSNRNHEKLRVNRKSSAIYKNSQMEICIEVLGDDPFEPGGKGGVGGGGGEF